MKTSFMSTALGIHGCEAQGIRYEDKRIILNIKTQEERLKCSSCGGSNVIKYGYVIRDFKSIPLCRREMIIQMKVQRLKCNDCGCIHQEKINFAKEKHSYTHFFAKVVIDLSRIATIKDVAWYLRVSWDTVKEIQKSYLKLHYSCPDIRNTRRIGIDEFSISKGNKYMTIVVDLDSGAIIHVGKGRDKNSLKLFWKRVRKLGVQIEAVATDMSGAFMASVHENLPNAVHVLDHFHISKMFNEVIDRMRRDLCIKYKKSELLNCIKGSRWLLLKNGSDVISNSKMKQKLEQALSINKPLAQSYYLKEELKLLWRQPSKDKAQIFFLQWIEKALCVRDPAVKRFAMNLKGRMKNILAWYDVHISTGPVEGINNKIKTMKRMAYGYRDQEFFKLKLYALHINTNAFSG